MKSGNFGNSWIVTVPLGGVAVAYLFIFFLPGQRAIDKLREELADKRNFVSEAGYVTPAIQASQQELKETLKYDGGWERSAPTEAGLSALFGQINALAKAAGTITTRFEPQPIVRHEEILRIPVVVGCSGSFDQVATFLHDVECLPQTVWVETLEMEDSGESREGVQCKITLVIFADNPDISDQVNLSG